MNVQSLFPALVVSVVTLACGPRYGKAAETLPDLRATLTEMGAADQAIRAKIGPLLASGKFQTDEFKALANEMASVDARNLADLKKIVEVHGWPDVRIVGRDASNSAFLILQHSPHDAQKEYLPAFREAVTAGKARGADLAMLEDRILIGEGKKQRYGTQVSAGSDGKPRVNEVEDPKTLDARRKEVGLPAMKDYLDRMEKDIGRPIDRSALE